MSKIQTGIRFDIDTVNKLKYMSWFSRTTNTDIIDKAVKEAIEQFEKTNGTITDKELKEARIIG